MKSGSLRELGDIEQDSSTTSDTAPDYSGRPFMRRVPSSIASVSGDETYRGRQLKAGTTHVVEIRRLQGVSPDMRYRVTQGSHRGKVLHIVSVRDMTAEGIPQRMQLDCKELTQLGRS